MPKPWPDSPVTMVRPGAPSAWSITGTTSGMVSIMPAQAALSFGRPSAGKVRANSARRRSTRGA